MFNTHSFFFRTCVYLVLSVLLAVPVLSQVGQGVSSDTGSANDYVAGRTDGEMAARASGMWFFAGFCLGGLGVLIAWLAKPSPSTAMLTGKSAAYVQGYIEGYKDKAGSKQLNKALVGLGVACVVYVVFYVALWAVIFEEADDDYDYDYGY